MASAGSAWTLKVFAVFLLAQLAVGTADQDRSKNMTGITGKVYELLARLHYGLEKDNATDFQAHVNSDAYYSGEITSTQTNIVDVKNLSVIQAVSDLELWAAEIVSDKLGLQEAANTLAKLERELVNATETREQERKSNQQSENSLMDTVQQLKRAMGVLAMSAPVTDLLQSGASLGSVANNLRTTLLQGKDLRLTATEREIIDSFVQQTVEMAPATPNKSPSKALAASAPSFLQVLRVPREGDGYGDYESQSGSAVAVLRGVLEKAEEQLGDVRGNEKNAAAAFVTVKTGKEGLIDGEKGTMTNLKQEISLKEQSIGSTKQELWEDKNVLNAAVKRVDELQSEWLRKSSDFTKRDLLRRDELTAVAEAMEIISCSDMKIYVAKYESDNGTAKAVSAAGAASFVQVGKVSRHRARLSANKARLSVRKAHLSARDDPFAKVRTLVREMLEKLENLQNQDADHNAFCVSEMEKTTQSLKDKQEDVQKLKSQISVFEAEISELSGDLSATADDLNATRVSLSLAETTRGSEQVRYTIAVGEYKEAQRILKDAFNILEKIYGSEGKSTMTADNHKNQTTSSFGSGIIGILEVAVQNYADLQKAAERSEVEAQADFNEFMTAAKVQEASLTKDDEYMSQRKLKLEGELTRAGQDLGSYTDQLNAVQTALDTLKQGCTAKVDTYAERVTRRDNELASLREALAILEGESIP